MKYLLIENSSNEVLLTLEQEPILRDSSIILPNSELLDQNRNTCTVQAVEDSAVPENFQSRAYTWIDGSWTQIADIPDAPKTVVLKYINYRIEKGTGAIDPLPISNDLIGIRNNGSDIAVLTIAAMNGPTIDSGVYGAVTGAYGDWPIVMRDDQGRVCDLIQATLVDGVATINYTATTNIRPGIYSFCAQKDLPRFETDTTIYKFRAGASAKLKIYREM